MKLETPGGTLCGGGQGNKKGELKLDVGTEKAVADLGNWKKRETADREKQQRNRRDGREGQKGLSEGKKDGAHKPCLLLQ